MFLKILRYEFFDFAENGSLQSKCNLVNGESQTSADIEGNMKTAEGEDAEEEESLEDLSKRSCPYCFKVCPKPSDLKRHLMVHTGERPFRCQVRRVPKVDSLHI